MASPREATRGSVLAVTLLILLALQLLAHGLLVLAMQEWEGSRAGLRVLQARAAAESAVIRMAGSPPTGTLLGLPVGGTTPGVSGSTEEATYRGRIRRLSREYWLAEGWGRARDATWEDHEGRLLWALDPLTRIASFTSVVQVGATLPVVDGWIDTGVPAPACGEWTAALDTALAGRRLGRASVLHGLGPAFGRMGLGDVLSDLPVHVAGVGRPEPVEHDGQCVADQPWNWGDPGAGAGAGACSGYRPARGAVGDLRVEGGVGQGLLVVEGDLELVGTLLHGLIVVGGDVRLTAGAHVEGLLQAGGGLSVDASSSVVGSPCLALRALLSASLALRRLRLVRSRGWLPLF